MAKSCLWLGLWLILASQMQAQINGVFVQVAGNYLAEFEQQYAVQSQFGLRTSLGLNLGERVSTGLKIQQLWYRAYSTAGSEH
ncbi:MAG: hypothetical protein AAFP02_08880, partial [Bacteroidota bacterium]